MEKKIVIYLFTGNYKRFVYVHSETIKNIKKIFKDNFFFLDVNVLLSNKNQNKKIKDKNFYIIKNLNELKNFLLNYNIHCFLSLGKSFKYFKILRLLKKHNVTLYEDFSIGILKEEKFFLSKNNFLEIFKKKFHFFEFLFFRFLVLIGYLPKIDVCFEGNKENIIRMQKQIGQRIQNKFRLNLAYKKKILHVNSRSFSTLLNNFHLQKEKYILFLDGGFDHPDVLIHSYAHTEENRKKYYYLLKKNLFILSDIYKKKIIFSVHPKVSAKKVAKYINNKKIKIVQFKTQKYILNAHTVVCHESSTVFDAILLKKRIIHLKGDVMGPFYQDRNNFYPKRIKIPSFELEDFNKLSKYKIDKFFENRFRLYDKYIINFVKNFDDYKKIFLKNKPSLLKKHDNLSGGYQIAKFIDQN